MFHSDELSRIESVYGSVAEYNRVRYENVPSEEHEISWLEYEMNNRKMNLYDKQIQYLTGKPSSLAIFLNKKWEKSFPKKPDGPTTMDYIYQCQDYHRDKLFDCVEKLNEKYGITMSVDSPVYSENPKTFGISAEFNRLGQIFTVNISDLDLKTFKDVFRDLDYLGMNPTMHYVCENGKFKSISNSSLGELRIYDFKLLDIESREVINAELKKVRLDDKSNEDYCSLKSKTPAYEKFVKKEAFGR